MMAGHRNDHGKRFHSQSDHSANGGSKRRNPGENGEQQGIGPEDTVFRYLCPVRKIGSIIGKGGDIIKQLRSESKSNIKIAEALPGCDERVVTIYSTSEETNSLRDTGEFVSPAQDALFMVYDRIAADEAPEEDEFEEIPQVTVRMLVPSDQIGCIIGKGGQVIQNIRSETRAQIRILRDEHLPPCALNSDELLQIIGEPAVVRKALLQVATRLHENPARSQTHLLSSSNMYQSGGMFMNPNVGPPLMGGYGDYRDEASAREFSVRIVCPTGNIGGVIGKGGVIIKQIRQESGASIKVDSSSAEGDDCIIFISAKEFLEDPSPATNAALLLQPRCSDRVERESGDSVITTRLLVPSSRIGCLIGKGGAIISEMRNATRANIRILPKEDLPKVASEDEELVQITGSTDVARNALLHVILRLKANLFEREGGLGAYPPPVPYIPMSVDMADGSRYGNRGSQPRGGRGHSSSAGMYSPGEIPPGDHHGSFGGSLSSNRSGYGSYGGNPSSRSGGAGVYGQTPVSHGKHHGY